MHLFLIGKEVLRQWNMFRDPWAVLPSSPEPWSFARQGFFLGKIVMADCHEKSRVLPNLAMWLCPNKEREQKCEML